MKRRIYPYDRRLKKRAQELRRESTFSEVLLWRRLKGGQVRGYDFHRQKPLGHYIVDFFCNELALVIEIDGGVHDKTVERDQLRQESLERLGVHFLRFTDEMVLRNPDKVVEQITAWIDRNSTCSPPPPDCPDSPTIPS